MYVYSNLMNFETRAFENERAFWRARVFLKKSLRGARCARSVSGARHVPNRIL